VKRNVTDDPPAAPGDPGDHEPLRRKESGNVPVQDERIPINLVNHSGELDTPFEVAVLTDPDLDRVIEGCVTHRTSIALPDAHRRG
jgi:hypothetical protein